MEFQSNFFVSVIICTHNRSSLLRRALTSVVEQDADPSKYEILVVDNGSTDNTKEVVAEPRKGPVIHYIYEPKLGLCIARNTGWREARGDIIAYFDDDAIASPGWISAIRNAFMMRGADIGVVGGPARPIWEIARPDWLADQLVCSLTAVDWGQEDRYIVDPAQEWLVGANMALPRKVLAAVGGFHPWLDRVGNNLLSSGDVFLQKEVIRRGYKCFYSSSMIIGHLAPASRLRQEWFLRRYYWQGVSDAVIDLIEKKPGLAGRVSLAIGRAQKLAKLDVIRLLFFKQHEADKFASKCFSLIDLGYVAGLLGAARR